MNKVKLKTIANGVEVAWHHDNKSLRTYLGIIVWAGSLDDLDGKEGLAHYLEHLLFKGTPSAPTTKDLTSKIESIGGALNAYTSTSTTFIFLDVPQSRAKLGWKTLCDLTFCPRLTAEDTERERKIILSEHAERDNQDALETQERINRQIFGEHLAKKPLMLGTVKGIRAIGSVDLATFHDKHYLHGPLTFVAVGNLTKLSKNFPDFVKKEFRHQDGRMEPTPRRNQPHIGSLPKVLRSTDLPTKYPQCIIAGPFYRESDSLQAGRADAQDRVAAGLIENILSGRGNSSLFMQKMRDEQQLAYSFGIGHQWLDRNLGSWEIRFSCLTPEDAKAAIAAITEIITNTPSFNDDTIGEAKASYLTHWRDEHHSLKDLFHWVGGCLAEYGQLVQWDEHQEQIKNATPRKVRAVLKEYYYPSKWVTVHFVPQ